MPRSPPGIPGKDAPPEPGGHALERLKQFERDRSPVPPAAPAPPASAPTPSRKPRRNAP